MLQLRGALLHRPPQSTQRSPRRARASPGVHLRRGVGRHPGCHGRHHHGIPKILAVDAAMSASTQEFHQRRRETVPWASSSARWTCSCPSCLCAQPDNLGLCGARADERSSSVDVHWEAEPQRPSSRRTADSAVADPDPHLDLLNMYKQPGVAAISYCGRQRNTGGLQIM